MCQVPLSSSGTTNWGLWPCSDGLSWQRMQRQPKTAIGWDRSHGHRQKSSEIEMIHFSSLFHTHTHSCSLILFVQSKLFHVVAFRRKWCRCRFSVFIWSNFDKLFITYKLDVDKPKLNGNLQTWYADTIHIKPSLLLSLCKNFRCFQCINMSRNCPAVKALWEACCAFG